MIDADNKTAKKSSGPSRSSTEIEPGCSGKELSDAGRWPLGQVVSTQIDEDVAMAFLFDTYDRGEKIARWCPAKDSEIIQHLYLKGSTAGLQTKTVFSARYTEAGNFQYFIIMQSEQFFDSCNACTVVLGGAIFHEINGLWHLKAINLAIDAAGSFGNAPANMSLIKIGPDLHAVLVIDGGSAQGVYQENLLLIGPVGDRIERVFFLYSAGGDNQGLCDMNGKSPNDQHACYAYNSTISLHQGSNPTYGDLELVIQGTKYQPYDNAIAFKEIYLYRFNGCSYVRGRMADLSDDKSYFVQVGAYERYRSANEHATQLSEAGFPAYCEFCRPDSGNSFFRVRVGNYGTVAEVEFVNYEIKKNGFDGFISQYR